MKEHTRKLFSKIFATLAPPPKMTLSEWADNYRMLSRKSSAEPGKWKTSRAPYQREIMDAISDTSVQKVVVMSAAQIGKTDGFILNTVGYYMDYDPSPILIVQPNVQPMAESFSKDRLTPMLNDNERLRDKVNDKSRNSGNTILHKEYPGGHITMVGANSPAGLASRPMRILLADEIDRYPATAGKEGDPLLLASVRLETFWNRKEVYISTPTIKGISRIEVEYERSTQEEWNVPCPVCGEYQPLAWEFVIFDKENPEEGTVHYKCRTCKEERTETTWKELFTQGKFVANKPGRKVRGFHINALASLFVKWNSVIKKFLQAKDEKEKGNVEQLKVWTNTAMGQTWQEGGSTLEWETLYKRRERYNCEVPQEVMYLTAGVDTQDDRFEIEVVGWGEDKESWGIQYKIIHGYLREEQVWKDLDAFLNQTFTRQDGVKLRITRACIDTGGHYANQVYKYCKPRTVSGIFPIKGMAGFEREFVPKATTNNRLKVPMFIVGVDVGKELLYQYLALEEEGPNYCHFPRETEKGYGQDYFRGLTAEQKLTSYKHGRAIYVWRKKEGYKRNEPLDCRNYAHAALEIANVILKKDEAGMQAAQPQKKPSGRRVRGSMGG